jgi:RNA polymerase sigma-70 factor, ECF subfamily
METRMDQSKIRIVNWEHFIPSHRQMDKHALEACFHEHHARIYEIVYRLLGDPDEAEDITAETFIKLWQSPPSTDENLAGWLYRVSTRLAYNALRAAKRRSSYEVQDQIGNVEASGPDPQQEAEAAVERARVRAALRQMPERDVQILILKHSGLSYKEIAGVVQVSASSVGSLLARAEDKFLRIYSKGGGPHAPE